MFRHRYGQNLSEILTFGSDLRHLLNPGHLVSENRKHKSSDFRHLLYLDGTVGSDSESLSKGIGAKFYKSAK